MNDEPENFLDRVDSPATFLEFLNVLRTELETARATGSSHPASAYERGPLGWENMTLPAFLEAMHAWGQDSTLPPQPSWRDVAQLLIAAKGYE